MTPGGRRSAVSEKTVYVCDRCGAVSEERTFGEFRAYSATPAFKRERRFDRDSYDPCDLCGECSEALYRFMKGGNDGQ